MRQGPRGCSHASGRVPLRTLVRSTFAYRDVVECPRVLRLGEPVRQPEAALHNLIAPKAGDEGRSDPWSAQMIHNPANALAAASHSDTKLRSLLGVMSVFTMIMTVPQVWTIWVGQQAAGVSILSWSAYLASAVLWLWFGIRQHDRNIYLPCLGWIALDGAVIVGAVVYG